MCKNVAYEDDKMDHNQINKIIEDIDVQIKDLRRLSNRTEDMIVVIKKNYINEINNRLDNIEARLKKVEDKNSVADKGIKPDVAGTKEDVNATGVDCSKQGVHPADIPASVFSSRESSGSEHIIETTMDSECMKGDVAEIIRIHEDKNKMIHDNPKENIFTKLMKKVIPSKKKEQRFANTEDFIKNKHDESGLRSPEVQKCGCVATTGSEVYDNAPQSRVDERPLNNVQAFPVSDTEPNHGIALETKAPEDSMDAVKNAIMTESSNDKFTEVEKETVVPLKTEEKKTEQDISAVDKEGIEPNIDDLIDSAKKLVDENKYAEATEIYLKLADVYDKDKPDLEENRHKIEELYDKISSGLLNNLASSNDGKNTKLHEQGKNV